MAPKPRGLKASKKHQTKSTSIPTQVNADAASPISDAAAGKRKAEAAAADDDSSERTMPLDRDFLSVQDLFELRETATRALDNLGLNEPVAAAAAATGEEPDPRQQVQSLCRGILHGCDALKTQLGGPTATGQDDTSRLKALGLDQLGGNAWILYLQAWALHHMAFVVQDSNSILKPRALESTLAQEQAQSTSSLSNKKRKIDVNEPTDPADWLDKAIDMYDEAKSALVTLAASATTTVGGDEDDNEAVRKFANLLIESDAFQCIHDRLDLSLIKHDSSSSSLVEKLSTLPQVPLQLRRQKLSNDDNNYWTRLQSFVDEYDDPFSAFVEAIRTHVKHVERNSNLSTSSSLDRSNLLSKAETQIDNILSCSCFKATATERDEQENDSSSSRENRRRIVIKFKLEHVRVETKLIKFVLIVEEEIYRKYRPDNIAAVDREDEEDEDEEGDEEEMVPLPVEADDVKHARELGQNVIQEIESLLERTNEVDVWDRKQVQSDLLTKLEEAYQVYSALFNAGQEDDKLNMIEQRIAQVQAQRG
ncbi:hypothetical protein ACM66B_004715 [Microbotryomycetes sp. NB124-2]